MEKASLILKNQKSCNKAEGMESGKYILLSQAGKKAKRDKSEKHIFFCQAKSLLPEAVVGLLLLLRQVGPGAPDPVVLINALIIFIGALAEDPVEGVVVHQAEHFALALKREEKIY